MLWHGCGRSCSAVRGETFRLAAPLTQNLLPVRLIASPMMSSPRVRPSATVLLLGSWPLPAGSGVELLTGRWSLPAGPGSGGRLLMPWAPLLWLWMSLLLLMLLLLLLPGGRLLLSLPWGWLLLLLCGRCVLRMPLLLMFLVATTIVELARAPVLPALSTGSTTSPGLAAARMSNCLRVG